MHKLWADLAKDRRQHLDVFADLIRTYPFFRRLWSRHLFWVVSFLYLILRGYSRRSVRACISAYYKLLDRRFGGAPLRQSSSKSATCCASTARPTASTGSAFP
jgi:hypothetical protein